MDTLGVDEHIVNEYRVGVDGIDAIGQMIVLGIKQDGLEVFGFQNFQEFLE